MFGGFLTPLVLLLGGLSLLWWFGDRAVRYSVELSEILEVSTFILGFIILSISTGLPELTIAIMSSLSAVPGLSAGDILGSNLVNVTFVLGISAIVGRKLFVEREDEKNMLLLLTVITGVMFALFLTLKLSSLEGIVLVATYLIAMWWLWRRGIGKKIVEEEREEAKEELEEEKLLKGRSGLVLKLLGSLVLVLIGARITVNSALSLTKILGLPLETMGATVVALGTGLPELSLELNAVKEREYELALGDIFGSTLTNATLILGILSILGSGHISLIPLLGIVPFFFIALGVIWYSMIFNHEMDRRTGVLLISIYLLYLIVEIGVLSFLV